MPRTKILASALALALGGTSAVQAQSFSDVIVFGDSLSDAGNIAVVQHLPAGNSFTTNPDPVYAEIVAAYFGDTLTNSLSGGTDYAYGGACARPNGGGFTCVNSPGSFSLPTQINTYLTAHSGHADPGALYMMWGGANDVFTAAGNPATAQLNTGIAAGTMVNLISTVQQAGARTIVVFNLPDLGLTPDNVGTANQAGASGLAFAYNSTFNSGLANLADGIVPINVFGLINEIVGTPSLYGFSDVTHKACGAGSTSVACGPTGSPLPFHYATGTNETYLFADSVHPTGAAHRILANVVIATLSAPGQVSMAGEIPLQVYDNASSTMNHQIFGLSTRDGSDGDTGVYAAAHFTNQDFNASANTNAFDNNLFTGVFGADVRFNDAFSFGAAISFGGSNGDAFGSGLDTKEVLLSGYGVAHFGRGWIDAIITGGSSNIDFERSIVMGATTRVEQGDTSASHVAGEIGAGFNFGGESINHGPFVSYTWQEVDVDGFAEDGLNSTAMWFSDFKRKSQVTRIGYQLQGRTGGFSPYARIAWASEGEDAVAAVQAGSNTMNGHFTLNGFIPAEDWMEADVGIDWALNDHTTLGAAYRGRFSDDTQDINSINLNVRWEFGNAPEAVPVAEAVVAPQATCADLDDDGDGVNNCDDKCPGSPAGEAVGADGCPVPAVEPAEEPKAFRN
jgi:outer membrane lipase/esterase